MYLDAIQAHFCRIDFYLDFILIIYYMLLAQSIEFSR